MLANHPRSINRTSHKRSTYKLPSSLPFTHKLHPPAPLPPLDPKSNIDPPLQRVQFSSDPRHLAREVDLVSQNLACSLVRAQGVEDAVHGAGGGFLVVENRQGGKCDDDDEGGESLEPGVGIFEGGKGAIWEAGEERTAGVGGWRDEVRSDGLGRGGGLSGSTAERVLVLSLERKAEELEYRLRW